MQQGLPQAIHIAVNCDLCYERLKNNEEPACSKACPTRCILWGDMKKVSEGIEERFLQQQTSESRLFYKKLRQKAFSFWMRFIPLPLKLLGMQDLKETHHPG